MFHVVYSRHYWDREDNYGTFANTWTLYRNCDYSQLETFGKSYLEMLKSNADQKYAEYEKTKNYKTDPTQFESSEVYIVDNSDYFKTYNDEYDYHMPSGLTPIEEDYLNDYGQKNQFMLIKDFDPKYTWFGKDWTQEQIAAEYEKRRLDNQARV